MFCESTTLKIFGRESSLFEHDFEAFNTEFAEIIGSSRFLVIGGAGSIGQAVVKQLVEFEPRKLHVVDISENNLAELVRDIRSSAGYFDGDFHAYCMDALGIEFQHYSQQHADFDYILNLAALKHVRSEKDPFTLSRLVRTNVLLPKRIYEFADKIRAKAFFNVSTDKATNPVSMMGASKRLMELFLTATKGVTPSTSARFANVAFSDGSLPFAWMRRLEKSQPIVAPRDIYRYFITSREAGILCLLAAIQGENNQIFLPRLERESHLACFADVALRFLDAANKSPILCETEEEARTFFDSSPNVDSAAWPCYLFESTTSGEKMEEQFFDEREQVTWTTASDIGVLRNTPVTSAKEIESVVEEIEKTLELGCPEVSELATKLSRVLPEFEHFDTGTHLDARM
ncbi:MAG: polysaccharide biosynthesis protein [Aureliella sp.]